MCETLIRRSVSTPDRPGPNERNHQEDRTGEKKKKGGQIVKKIMKKKKTGRR